MKMSDEKCVKLEVRQEKCDSEKDLKGIVNDELTRVGSGGPWVW